MVGPPRLSGVVVRPLNFTVMRHSLLALLVLVGACAHDRVDPGTCPYVGSDWKLQRSAPPNAAQLIATLGTDSLSSIDPTHRYDSYWFKRPDGQLLYCEVSRCNGQSFRFESDGTRWTARRDLGGIWVTADCRR